MSLQSIHEARGTLKCIFTFSSSTIWLILNTVHAVTADYLGEMSLRKKTLLSQKGSKRKPTLFARGGG
jgi:hypothetical protein